MNWLDQNVIRGRERDTVAENIIGALKIRNNYFSLLLLVKLLLLIFLVSLCSNFFASFLNFPFYSTRIKVQYLKNEYFDRLPKMISHFRSTNNIFADCRETDKVRQNIYFWLRFGMVNAINDGFCTPDIFNGHLKPVFE